MNYLLNFIFVESLKRQKYEVSDMLPSKKDMFFQLLKHPMCRPYFRLAFGVVFVNALILFQNLEYLQEKSKLQFLLNAALINFLIGAFVRQQWFINFLFKVATSVPKSWPLWFRWSCGKVYHFGGIHIGSFLSGAFWFFIYTGLVFYNGPDLYNLPQSISWINLLSSMILLAMMTTSLPRFRHPYHNIFEIVARFGLWSVVLICWIQVIKISSFQNIDLLKNSSFYILSYLSFIILLPWFRLKKVSLNIETPSNHVALVNFDYGVTPFAGSSTDLSLNPLFEWHSFANIPEPGKEGFRLTISRAGDWTGSLIQEKPKQVWVKGIPTAGVGNIELCFKKVIWVATGSGIGPCIPHLLDQKVPSRLVWSTRSPIKTYGEELVNEIKHAQPEAIIWDTTENGKPNLLELAYKAYREFDAEAVIVISNKKTTFHINYELERRGIPSFGAIWDS